MLLAVHYRVMERLGSLESTQETRVALGYRLGQLLRFFRALQIWETIPMKIKCLEFNSFKKEYKLFLLESQAC